MADLMTHVWYMTLYMVHGRFLSKKWHTCFLLLTLNQLTLAYFRLTYWRIYKGHMHPKSGIFLFRIVCIEKNNFLQSTVKNAKSSLIFSSKGDACICFLKMLLIMVTCLVLFLYHNTGWADSFSNRKDLVFICNT